MEKIIILLVCLLVSTSNVSAQQTVELIKSCQQLKIKSSQGLMIEGLKVKIKKNDQILTAYELVTNFDSVVLTISNARVVSLPTSISDTLEFLFQSSFNGPAPMDYPFKLTGYLKATHQFSAIELGSLVATSKTATDITCFEKMWTLSPFISLNCDQSSSVFSLCIQTGLEEDQGNKKIQFYPNPFTDRLTIEYEGQEKLEMKLFSLTGEFIKSLCVGENELKELSSGVYIITSPFFVRKITKFGGFCCENV